MKTNKVLIASNIRKILGIEKWHFIWKKVCVCMWKETTDTEEALDMEGWEVEVYMGEGTGHGRGHCIWEKALDIEGGTGYRRRHCMW